MASLPMILGGGGEKLIFFASCGSGRDGSYYQNGSLSYYDSEYVTITTNSNTSLNPYAFKMNKACKIRVYWGAMGRGTAANGAYFRLNGSDLTHGGEYTVNVNDAFTTQTPRYTAGASMGMCVLVI